MPTIDDLILTRQMASRPKGLAPYGEIEATL